MSEEVLKDAEARMEKAIEVLRSELATVRAGRATPALLEKVSVDYYGVPTPIHQLATITVADARLLVVQPWDRSALAAIERAIQKAELGLNPQNDGQVIRIVVPPLTEERRKELTKLVRRFGEEARVAIRNVRRDAIEELRRREKEGLLSEDESRRLQERVQKLTDQMVGRVDTLVEQKEKELLEI
ncbi:MAG: Ribosome recycling factor [Brockia lithotrophica]|uniref:Ribosome-recycling factor n=1 Tax=Brockia lithotrophica TaxID=933949 RepID=A0A2T5G8X4_9BACL|nr:ribosome recycling factor [Brockia lithotrophica]PTQ52641.1 MAG: Ribosome recycling factor [Brockia lithotrophica]